MALAFGSLIALLLAGCVSLGDPSPLEPRYFNPALLPSPAQDRELLASAPELVVADIRVDAAEHLGKRFVWSDERGEVGFIEGHRWALEPAQIAAARLRERVAADPRFSQTLRTGDGAQQSRVSLALRLASFGEHRTSTGRVARVEIFVDVYDDRNQRIDSHVLRGERRVDAEGPEALVAALWAELDQQFDRLFASLVRETPA